MVGITLDDVMVNRILDTYKRTKNKMQTAKELGLAINTVKKYIRLAYGPAEVAPRIVAPELPDGDLDTDDIIRLRKQAFSRAYERVKAQRWMTFEVQDDGPIAIMLVGDPHVDDNGCNWPLLEQHLTALASTEHAYGINLGDSHNNWVGRLMRKYADQDTSKDTAYKLVEWLFEGSGVEWLVMLLGNHDTFTDDGARLLKRMAQNVCPMIDWRAQVKLRFPNGRELLMDLAHDHKGHSQWNNLHGQEKVALMGRCPHIVAAGDKHNWAIKQKEVAEQEMVTWLIRARGYKCIDEYAVRNQFDQQEHGHSVLVVVDPYAGAVGFVQAFADPIEGLEFFKWKRQRWEKGRGRR